MALTSGNRVGPYEILAPIGAGGMGEVYRARDSKLGRDVALKVLPEAFARDAERMARFQREAKVLASLSHPNIAPIYGLEDSSTTHALVMELIEGPTLADRIKSGPIPIDEALRIAKQITEALEYAHERGIVHRDLKPANIKVTSDDAVKVLDFGLAKALEGDASSIDIANSPTVSRMATQAGVLLGTAAYMSPEQAKGKAVDRRADIWAFGCVLYEMLTGKMAFRGESVTDTLAAVIRAEPDWSQLPAATPIRVRVLLQRCLQKDPKQRLRDIGDARISLDEVLAGAPEPSSVAAPVSAPVWRRALPWALFGATAVALAVVGWVLLRGVNAPALAQVLRYQIFPPEKASFGTALALSPDGRHLAFTAAAQDGRTQLWVRDLDALVSRPLPGTEDAAYAFWSPDSHVLGFTTTNRLERVDISGGAPPQTICDMATGILGGAWNQDGVIVFGRYGGLMRVSAAGGTPSLLTKVDASRGEGDDRYPSFLPDGRRFLYSPGGPGDVQGTYVGSLGAGPEQQNAKALLALDAVYAPASGPGPGRILFLQNGTLMAQAFDADRIELQGDPAPIVQQVDSFTVSTSGVLAYTGGHPAPLQLTWFDRQGKVLGTIGEPGISPSWPAISPDGSAVAVPRTDLEGGGEDLWLYNLARGTRSRLTFDGKGNGFPVWSPDGSHIAFSSARDGSLNVYQKAISGIGQVEALDKTPADIRLPLDWSRDGRYLIEGTLSGGLGAIWVLPLSPGQTAGDQKSFPYLNDRFSEFGGKLSPNGQWLAYASDETKRYEIYVQTFPKLGGKWLVSINGGTRPIWSRDGEELYFIGADGKLMAVDVKSGPGGSFEAGTPKALFDPHIGGGQSTGFDVAKDGRFLIPTVVEQSGAPITVVVNWTAGLNK
jgi:eukaryotic-like serine/threonine-protein kinase